MIFILFAIIGLILFIILAKFVAKGLSFKYKLLVLISSFSLVLMTYFAHLIYSIWIVSIMVCVLGGLSTYLLVKQLRNMETQQVKQDDGTKEEIIVDQVQPSVISQNMESISEVEEVHKEDGSQEEWNSIAEITVTEEISEWSLEDRQDEMEQITENPTPENVTENEIMEESLENDVEDLLIRNDLQESYEQVSAYSEIEDEFLFEPKEMKEEDHLILAEDFLDGELSPLRAEMEENAEEEKKEEESEVDIEEIQEESDRKFLFDELEQDWEVAPEIQEKIVPSNVQMDEAILEDKKSVADAWMEEMIMEEMVNPVEEIMDIDFVESVAVDFGESVAADSEEPVNVVREQFLSQLLIHLDWMKKHVSAGRYEKFLKQYHTPSLPDKEYYIITSLLRDHLIETHQYLAAEDLLLGIIGRYSQYQILSIEIDEYLKYIKSKM